MGAALFRYSPATPWSMPGKGGAGDRLPVSLSGNEGRLTFVIELRHLGLERIVVFSVKAVVGGSI